MISPKKLIDIAMAEAMLGATLGMIAAPLLSKSTIKDIVAEVKDDKIVDVKKMIQDRFPNVDLITNKKDLYANKDVSFIDKLIASGVFKQPHNAAYIPTDKGGVVLSQPYASERIIGHELGHHIDMGGKKPGFIKDMLAASGIMDLVGYREKKEKAAWELNPIKSENKNLENLNMSIVEKAKNYSRAGAAIGIALGLLRHSIPKKQAIKAITSGNIR